MDDYEWWARAVTQFLRQYIWLLDAYVIEYFTEAHWSKLPVSWQTSLRGVEETQVAQFLLSSPFLRHRKTATVDRLHPLSLLAFVVAAHTLAVTRRPPQQLRGEAGETETAVARGEGFNEVTEKVGGSAKSGCATESDRIAGKVKETVEAQVAGLGHVFRRHVKPKKQHEIKYLAKEVMKVVARTGCRNIIDIGSGQGHLARYLAYHCGLRVVTVEAVGCHLVNAAKYDSEVERDVFKRARKMKIPDSTVGSVTHVESVIQADVSMEDLLSRLGLWSVDSSSPCSECDKLSCHSTAGQASGPESTFILVGLHTCGDLAPTMLRVYVQSRRVVGLLSVGCCFMKLSCGQREDKRALEHSPSPDNCQSIRDRERRFMTGSDVVGDDCRESEGTSDVCGGDCVPSAVRGALSETKVWGYPMSHCLSKTSIQLSYEAREVACHSIETYRERILESSHHVKVHCHRAVVETILRKYGLRRSQIKISRKISRLPFKEYASAVLEGLNLPLSELETSRGQLTALLSEWREVAVFFMLRLVLAPCVETLLMLDRVLFLKEKGFEAKLEAVFDAALSPRNLLISSHK